MVISCRWTHQGTARPWQFFPETNDNRVVDLQAIDLTDLDQFARGFPHHLFTTLRHTAPVWWHEPTVHTPDGEGFWSVHTHAECMTVIHDPVTFSSETGGGRPYGGFGSKHRRTRLPSYSRSRTWSTVRPAAS